MLPMCRDILLSIAMEMIIFLKDLYYQANNFQQKRI